MHFLPEEKITDTYFFSRGDRIDPLVLECRDRAHSNKKSLDQNFEIASLFSIVEKSINYVFEDDITPRVPGEGLPLMIFPHCSHVVLIIRKYTYIISWGDSWEGVTWEDHFMEEFMMGEENFDEGNAGFASIISKQRKIQNFCIHIWCKNSK